MDTKPRERPVMKCPTCGNEGKRCNPHPDDGRVWWFCLECVEYYGPEGEPEAATVTEGLEAK